MAGITLSRLHRLFPKAKNIVRSMPNTPGQIGAGATGYFFLNDPENDDAKIIRNILSSSWPNLSPQKKVTLIT